MAALNELFGKGFAGFGLGSIMDIVTIVGSILVFAIVAGMMFLWIKKRGNYNLKVEFKIPRSAGRLVNAEWGKGSYDEKRGVVWLKRRRKPKVKMKPFDVKRFLQGANILTVVQVGAADYLPALPDSYIKMKDDKHPEKEAAFLSIKTDTSESKAWKESFEREAKNAFSISTLLDKYGAWISIGLVIFLWGLQFALMYKKCGA